MGGAVQIWLTEGDRVRPLLGEHGAWWPSLGGDSGHAIESPSGAAWLEPVPLNHGAWLQLGPDDTPPETRPVRAEAAAQVLGQLLARERESGMIAQELSARYEEIDLLYTISDILGRTVELREAAQRIVREVSSVVGARRASIMVCDEPAGLLRVVAGRGLDADKTLPVPVDDEGSVAARAFRERRIIACDRAADAPAPRAGAESRGYRGVSYLSVPILYATPGGEPRPVGVINLTDRLGEDVFTPGNKKLVAAIANQIGAAIENARLVGEERRRERLSTELALAHDLQAALMPPQALLDKAGDIGARSQSAESVGGDFYDLINLRRDKIGVMLGDVSSHGLSAALVMAHAISAAGLLAQTAATPELALQRLLEVVGDELRRTEMYLALFYGVVDKRRGTLRYANAGHPHAFLVPGGGDEPRRLVATAPPLGLAGESVVLGAETRWKVGDDLLCLFTDGMVESKNAAGERYGEPRLLKAVRANAGRPAGEIVDAVFADLQAFSDVPHEDDRTLLILRR